MINKKKILKTLKAILFALEIIHYFHLFISFLS